MPDKADWSDKSERQYDQVKESERQMGKTDAEAEESAALTVNKEQARKGDAKEVVENE
ncbi:hypothetical protein [Demequina aurantiaca]|uniref:hypothetical protein n=1 Tax=Demequina aurantiaca TaxID=676200 RepID=UPI003D32B633